MFFFTGGSVVMDYEEAISSTNWMAKGCVHIKLITFLG